MKILIQNGLVFDGAKFIEADILTEDAVILKIAPNIQAEANYTYDARGQLIAPGLVDAHVHLSGPEADLYGIHPELCAIPFWVTAVADAGGACASKALVDTYLLKSVTFVKVPIRDNQPHFEWTEDKLKQYGGHAIGLKAYFDTATRNVTDAKPLAQICDYAREKGLKVMVHCTNSPVPMGEFLECLAPGDIVTHAFHGGVHTAAEDSYQALLAAQKRGIIVDTGFAGYVHTDFAVFRGAIQKGLIPNCISTDITRNSIYKRGGRYGLTMAMSMAQTAGMTREQVLQAVTVNPARALGKEGVWGVLREGGCADLCALEYGDHGYSLTDRNGNTLADEKGYRCKLCLANGLMVWRD